MSPAPYRRVFDLDDLEHLAAWATYVSPPGFEEAFERLSGGTDRAVAREAYADFLAESQPSNPGLLVPGGRGEFS